MKTPVDTVFAFQGGGAKFFAHLAILESIFELNIGKEIYMKGAVGTSAGAVAAAILGTGQNPSEFRTRFGIYAPKYLAKLPKNLSKLDMAAAIFFGRSVVNETLLRDFVRDFFTPEWADMPLSKLPIPVRLVVSDIRYGEKFIFNEKNDTKLCDAIVHSCAVPLYFRSFSNPSGYVDGGLCSNLPGEEVLGIARDAEIFGFSFKKTAFNSQSSGITGFPSLLKSLLTTSIETSVAEAAARLKSMGAAVLEIDSKIKTFQFGAAIQEVNGPGEEYKRIREETTQWMRHELHRKRQYRQSVIPVDDQISAKLKRLMDAVYQVHLDSLADVDFKIRKFVIECVCNSLVPERVNLFGTSDEVLQTLTLMPIEKPLLSYSLGLGQASWPLYDTQIDYRVTDENGQRLNCRIIPMVVELPNRGGSLWRSCVFYFYPPLQPDKTYEIRCSVRVESALSRIRKGEDKDWFCYTSQQAKLIETLELVAYIPEEAGDLDVLDFFDSTHELPRGHWATGHESAGKLVRASRLVADGSGPYHRPRFLTAWLSACDLHVGYSAGLFFRRKA